MDSAAAVQYNKIPLDKNLIELEVLAQGRLSNG
jgi:hypothetical protein